MNMQSYKKPMMAGKTAQSKMASKQNPKMVKSPEKKEKVSMARMMKKK